MKEKAEVSAHGYFQQRGSRLKKGTLTPLVYTTHDYKY